MSSGERSFLSAVSQLAYCNPFLPERITYERDALGADFVEGEPVWSLPVDEPDRPRANVWRVVERLEKVTETVRQRLPNAQAGKPLLLLYEDAVIHLLYRGAAGPSGRSGSRTRKAVKARPVSNRLPSPIG